MTMRVASDFGACEISSLPGQSQVAVCHSFFIADGARRQGRGAELKASQMAALERLHYDFAICTVADGNHAQRTILEQLGWKKLAEFRNTRSSETTELWGAQV